MELIGAYTSPFVRRVGVTLHLYQVPYRQRPLATLADMEEIRRLNPLGRVPALVLGNGEVLIDSITIIDWLDEQAGPGRALIAGHGTNRRRVQRLTAVALGTSEKYVAAFYERERRPSVQQWPPWLKHLEDQVRHGLGWLEASLEGPWMIGMTMTHADIAVAAALLAMRLDMPHLASATEFPKLHGLVERAAKLPAFIATCPFTAMRLSTMP